LECIYILFFFQAEDGIRDFHVTGVQTCALPIFPQHDAELHAAQLAASTAVAVEGARAHPQAASARTARAVARLGRGRQMGLRPRSEERRVGKECRYQGRPCEYKTK